jgi:hypothetical protein
MSHGPVAPGNVLKSVDKSRLFIGFPNVSGTEEGFSSHPAYAPRKSLITDNFHYRYPGILAKNKLENSRRPSTWQANPMAGLRQQQTSGNANLRSETGVSLDCIRLISRTLLGTV